MTSEVPTRSVPRVSSIDRDAYGRQAARRIGPSPVRLPGPPVRPATPISDPPNLDVALAWARGFDAARRYVNRLYPKRGRMLEVGSGYGFLMAAFKADGWRVHGIDTDEASCRYARERNGVVAHAVPLGDAGIPNEAFDVVIFGRLLAAQTDLLQVLTEAGRILRPGGHCLIHLPRGRHAEASVDGRDKALGAGFRIVPSHQLDPRVDNLLRTVSRRLRRLRSGRMSESQPPEGWARVWLQRVAVAAAVATGSDAAGHDAAAEIATRAALPAWLSHEVAGVVTVAAHRDPVEPDIRRGYPWRAPDRHFGRGAVVTVTH